MKLLYHFQVSRNKKKRKNENLHAPSEFKISEKSVIIHPSLRGPRYCKSFLYLRKNYSFDTPRNKYNPGVSSSSGRGLMHGWNRYSQGVKMFEREREREKEKSVSFLISFDDQTFEGRSLTSGRTNS